MKLRALIRKTVIENALVKSATMAELLTKELMFVLTDNFEWKPKKKRRTK